jgi:hypothetical protein
LHTSDYCRDVEAHLCRKNDGHLIRVVGPSFELVSTWEAQGIPLKVVFSGIDRCIERSRRQRPKRRPIKIEFCEADVLDAFDAWRRALGVQIQEAAAQSSARMNESPHRGPSLTVHLERVLRRLSEARAQGRIGDAFDPVIDAVAREHDAARAAAGGARGDTRRALVARLAAIDEELLQVGQATLGESARSALRREAEGQIAQFQDRMGPQVFDRVREAAFSRLVRERLGLPTVVFPPS